MIERHWKGVAIPEKTQHYITHLQTKTFPHMAGMPGFLKATILKRPVDKGMEFLIVSVWEKIESIKQFAGEQIEVANVPREAQEMMIEYDRLVVHYEVAGEIARR